jgi:ubiquinone/menaquinone biosynthesis C-methylase UbiE
MMSHHFAATERNEREELNIMSHSPKPEREHPSTYFVQDRSNLEEMARLEIQDTMITAGMGGVLPELSDPTHLRRVLDVGCGTGGWLMETAKSYPSIETLIGADVSSNMLAHARAQAEKLGLGGRVQFQTMDALRMLEFPNAFFDLVNQRFGISWLRTWEWQKILLEYIRVVRPGGIIRITEGHVSSESNSPALEKLYKIGLETCYNSGRIFTFSSDGLVRELVRLMTLHGIENIKSRMRILAYRAGTESHSSFYEDMRRAFRVALPFFQKWTRVPGDYEQIYQQALKEMQQPNFVAMYMLLTAWGTTCEDGNIPRRRGLN